MSRRLVVNSPKWEDKIQNIKGGVFARIGASVSILDYLTQYKTDEGKSQFLRSVFIYYLSKYVTRSIIFTKENITSVNREIIQNSIRHYLIELTSASHSREKDSCKDIDVNSLSDAIANRYSIDSFEYSLSSTNNNCIEVNEINDWMLNELYYNPNDLYRITSRRFEELIAEILMRKGYNVELTPATHDGGKDIYATSKNDLGSFLYIIECKKYNPTHKVGVNVLRNLYGVLSKERATYGIIITTSSFSKPAYDFQKGLCFHMSLKDFDSVRQWLYDVTQLSLSTAGVK